METRDIIIFIAVFSFAAFRLYQKYGKKGINNNTQQTKGPVSPFATKQKEDDYEPYSGK